MLANMYIVEETRLPKSYSDPKFTEWAAELEREFRAYQKPRLRLETLIWPYCDQAFHCIREDMPYLPTMKLIDNTMLGSDSIRTALKSVRNQQLSSLLPTDESYVELASMEEDDNEEALGNTKELLLAKCDEAKLRKNTSAFLDQFNVRGISAMGVTWDQRYTVKRAPRNMVKDLIDVAGDAAMDDEGNPIDPKGPVRYYKQIYNGANVFPIDMYRLWFDPKADLNIANSTGYIYLTFKSLSDLKNAQEEDPVTKKPKPFYDQDALEEVEEWKYSDYYHENPAACASIKLLGIDPDLEDCGTFVPVYLFYRQQREFEDGSVFVDKFFYVARSKSGGGWKIIRVQDNPSDSGCAPFYVATCDQWLTTPYGTGLAEKSLSAWRAGNIMDAVGLNMSVLNAAPPQYYVGGVIKDDKKPKYVPGGFQEIVMRPQVGLDWIKPFPVNPNNVELGLRMTQYYDSKIVSQTGASAAAITTDPNKSLSKSPTATEVRQVSNEGGQANQTVVDQIGSEVLEPVIQAILEGMRQNLTDESTKFITMSNGMPTSKSIKRDELNKDRTVKVVGRRGMSSKAHTLQNLNEILKVIAMPQAAEALGPGVRIMGQDVLVKLVSALGLAVKPEYKASPEELLSADPKIQELAVQQALQDPQKRQLIAEELLNSPEGQQYVMQLMEHIKQHVVSQQAPQVPAPQGAPGGM